MEDNYFTILWWFWLYIDMNQPRLYMCPSVLKPPPTSVPIPYLWVVQSTGLEYPASCIKLALVIYFTYGNVHVSMLSSHIIHPHLLPHSPIICSLHLCLFCCLANKIVITIFLNSILLLLLSHFSHVQLCVTP